MAEGAPKVVRTLHFKFTLPAADPAQLLVVELEQVTALEHDPARDAGRAAAGETHRGQRGDGLAGARLPDDAQGGALSQLVGDPVDRVHDAVIGGELHVQVLDREQWRPEAHE